MEIIALHINSPFQRPPKNANSPNSANLLFTKKGKKTNKKKTPYIELNLEKNSYFEYMNYIP